MAVAGLGTMLGASPCLQPILHCKLHMALQRWDAAQRSGGERGSIAKWPEPQPALAGQMGGGGGRTTVQHGSMAHLADSVPCNT